MSTSSGIGTLKSSMFKISVLSMFFVLFVIGQERFSGHYAAYARNTYDSSDWCTEIGPRTANIYSWVAQNQQCTLVHDEQPTSTSHHVQKHKKWNRFKQHASTNIKQSKNATHRKLKGSKRQKKREKKKKQWQQHKHKNDERKKKRKERNIKTTPAIAI